jgi:ABC-type uncharacterized transport system permease subunit
VMNIGIEGMMLVGALATFVVAHDTGSAWLGLLAGAGGGLLLAALFAVAVVVLRADMIMVGFALWFIGIAVAAQAGAGYVLKKTSVTMGPVNIPGLSKLPYVGPGLFGQPLLAYVAFLLPFGVHWLLSHTRHGLAMRAIGESPATADAMGIRVTFWRFAYVLVGGALAGLGGSFLVLVTLHTWLDGATAGQGWIAFALVIFARWRPRALIAGAYLFGGLQTLGFVAQALGWGVPSEFFTALPYLGTVAVIVVVSWASVRRAGWSAWPASLGATFVRGTD